MKDERPYEWREYKGIWNVEESSEGEPEISSRDAESTGLTVGGYCPMGCGETLQLSSYGVVVCMNQSCPKPYAVTKLLADSETEHIVRFTEDDFVVRHPLRERLDDELMRCELHQYVNQNFGQPPDGAEYWRVTKLDELFEGSGPGWTWAPLS